MRAPYDHASLWAKARVFINRAMDPEPTRSFDEQALWASLALELLGKAALAKVSPLLIAEPTEDGANVLIAVGLIEGTAKFTSVRASTVFKRCGKAFRPFNAATAMTIADARNEYLHGAGVGIAPLDPDKWWPRFWALASILLDAQDRDLDEFVGSERVATAQKHLDQNAKNVEHRVESLLNRAQQRLSQAKSGTLPAKIQAEWSTSINHSAGLSYSTLADCPACDAQGTLEGDDGSNMSYEYERDGDEDDPFAMSFWANVDVPSDYFSCPTCHLVLDGYDLIVQAGLPDHFTVIDDDPPLEEEYGND